MAAKRGQYKTVAITPETYARLEAFKNSGGQFRSAGLAINTLLDWAEYSDIFDRVSLNGYMLFCQQRAHLKMTGISEEERAKQLDSMDHQELLKEAHAERKYWTDRLRELLAEQTSESQYRQAAEVLVE